MFQQKTKLTETVLLLTPHNSTKLRYYGTVHPIRRHCRPFFFRIGVNVC